jgi:plastocyanin
MKRITSTLVVGLVALTACGGGGSAVADGEELQIALTEFEFTPSTIRLIPGTTVTFVLTNDGEKPHEFMVGNDVSVEDGIPHGFESDFFATVENLSIDPPDAQSMEMEDMGEDESMGDMASTTMGDMADDEMEEEVGVMVVREPTQVARITFTVTEASIGEWEIGCFEDDGAHWDDGMKGTLVVEQA